MRKLVDYKLVNKSDVYTSYKFNEYHHHFKDWYDAVADINYEELAEISNKSGDVLITSDYSFCERIYLKFKEDNIERLYKEWEKVKKSIPEKKDDLNVYIRELKDKEGLKKEIVEYFKEKYTYEVNVVAKEDIFMINLLDVTDITTITKLNVSKNSKLGKCLQLDERTSFYEFFKNKAEQISFKFLNKHIEDFYNKKGYFPILKENKHLFLNAFEENNIEIDLKDAELIDNIYFIKPDVFEKIKNKINENIENRRKKFLKKMEEGDIEACYKTVYIDELYEGKEKEEIIKIFKKRLEEVEKIRSKKEEEKLKEQLKKFEEFKRNLYKLLPEGTKRFEFNINYNRIKDKKLYEEYKKADRFISFEVTTVYTPFGVIFGSKENKVWKIKVPDELKGKFIGKGGRGIKKIIDEYFFLEKIIVV